MAEYQFDKAGVSTDLLMVQIGNSEDIAKTVSHINFAAPDSLSVFFESALTAEEETALGVLVADHDVADSGFYKDNHCVEEPVPGNLTKEVWYQDCDENNNVSNLAKEVVIAWSGSKKLSTTTKKYFKGGTLAEESVVEHKWDRPNKKVLHKKVS